MVARRFSTTLLTSPGGKLSRSGGSMPLKQFPAFPKQLAHLPSELLLFTREVAMLQGVAIAFGCA
jgi:hypothetical protein